MRKTIFSLAALLVLFSAAALAQPGRSEAAVRVLLEDQTRGGNNLNSYEFHEIRDTPAPAGYRAFYISHYGRHGSRSNWGGRSYEDLIGTLEAGRALGILTPGGDSLEVAARKILAAYDGMDGRLTRRGVREHAAQAERMYRRYPEVFDGARRVRAVSSTVPRCIISMNAFTNALARQNSALDIQPDTGEKFMLYINPTEGWQKITAAANRKSWEYLSKMPDDTLGVLSRLFTDPEKARSIVERPWRLTQNVWDAAVVAEDFDIEENLFRFLPFDAFYRRWAQDNISLYLGHCNSADAGALRVPLAQPSVADIVAKADEAIASGEYAADLRFGHDYPLMTLVSYLGIEGVGERYEIPEICDNWWGFWNIPMASNLQLIFYRSDDGPVLVKFLYQEQERLLRGLAPYSGPYYVWETVKANLEGYKR